MNNNDVSYLMNILNSMDKNQLAQNIDKFKNMLQNNSSEKSNSPKESQVSSKSVNDSQSPNISPEMISNLANMLKNNGLGSPNRFF